MPITLSRNVSSLYRVVMRTSEGWDPPQKGWSETSMRPQSQLKPIVEAISRTAFSCFCTSKPPAVKAGFCSSFFAFFTRAIKGTSPSRTSVRISSNRCGDVPRSNLSTW